jgi:GNAT superfamily N-acetyltransferase
MIETPTIADINKLSDLISFTISSCVSAEESDLKAIIAHSVEASRNHLMGKINGAHLIYREDEELIGVVLVKDYWNMVSLFVAPSHQRKGIATHLMDRALEICSRKSPKGMVACNSSEYAVNDAQRGSFYLVYKL